MRLLKVINILPVFSLICINTGHAAGETPTYASYCGTMGFSVCFTKLLTEYNALVQQTNTQVRQMEELKQVLNATQLAFQLEASQKIENFNNTNNENINAFRTEVNGKINTTKGDLENTKKELKGIIDQKDSDTSKAITSLQNEKNIQIRSLTETTDATNNSVKKIDNDVSDLKSGLNNITYKYFWNTGSSYGTINLQGVFNKIIVQDKMAKPGDVLSCILKTNNQFHWNGFMFTVGLTYVEDAKYKHAISGVTRITAATGEGCSDGLRNTNGTNFELIPGNCKQTATLYCATIYSYDPRNQ